MTSICFFIIYREKQKSLILKMILENGKKKNHEQSKKFSLYKVQISFAVRPDCSPAVKK